MDDALSKLCLVLERVDGVPLGAFVRGLPGGRHRPVEPHGGASEAGALASSLSARSLLVCDILNVLCYLHSRQPVIVHADLKDTNVFVEERRGRTGRTSYRAKLLDFGLSRILTRRARPLGGTPRWMAPELLSRVPPDAAADCYSFGLLAYFIVTGGLPFEGKGTDQVMRRLRGGRPPRLTWPAPADELCQACRPLVEQCTQLKPALRPTAKQVSDELSVVLSHVAGGAAEAVIQQEVAGLPGAKAAAGASVEDLQEFRGVVEVSHASSASIGSLVSRGSRDLPPVQEHEARGTGGGRSMNPRSPARTPWIGARGPGRFGSCRSRFLAIGAADRRVLGRRRGAFAPEPREAAEAAGPPQVQADAAEHGGAHAVVPAAAVELLGDGQRLLLAARCPALPGQGPEGAQPEGVHHAAGERHLRPVRQLWAADDSRPVLLRVLRGGAQRGRGRSLGRRACRLSQPRPEQFSEASPPVEGQWASGIRATKNSCHLVACCLASVGSRGSPGAS
ncbi:unnamed protein product [Prorocentrum cordatum]|uniref:Protein kinase domain-containing protein n=1 Tax=Prorocentrum cordatum TaxID=2364126 RepID=A0ABN9XAD5_9DINO|nr:unnamed protein product [Polarella glacialis]